MPDETGQEVLFGLTAEQTSELKKTQPRIVQANKDLQLLKDLGVDTKDLQEKLDWAARVQATIGSRLK